MQELRAVLNEFIDLTAADAESRADPSSSTDATPLQHAMVEVVLELLTSNLELFYPSIEDQTLLLVGMVDQYVRGELSELKKSVLGPLIHRLCASDGSGSRMPVLVGKAQETQRQRQKSEEPAIEAATRTSTNAQQGPYSDADE